MIFSLPLDQVNADRLEALKTDGIREGRHLEYKESLPGTSDDEKKEFLADATSFANAAGGDLIYGVRGSRDPAGADRRDRGDSRIAASTRTPRNSDSKT